ncbi:MAG: hypothetical protein F4020_08705 [Gammaproteobacteria bacterium]|nr:hypothetical protein [Gammaproteobacteria bacterium]
MRPVETSEQGNPVARVTSRARRPGGLLFSLSLTLLLTTCRDPVEPPVERVAAIEFSAATLELVASRDGSALSYRGAVDLANTGNVAVGPVSLSARAARTGGVAVPGMIPTTTPSEIPTLNPGTSETVSIVVMVPDAAQAGSYEATLEAQAGSDARASLGLRFQVEQRVGPVDGTHIRIAAGNRRIRQGDVVRFSAEVRDSSGAAVQGAQVTWRTTPPDAGLFDADGRFVAYAPGNITVAAHTQVNVNGTIRPDSATTPVTVQARGLSQALRLVGKGAVDDRYTSDLWVHGDHAYTGTWGMRAEHPGNLLYAWTLDAAGMPALSDSLVVSARTVNDVKIRADGRLGVLTHEGDPEGLNGVTFFDLSDPAHPQIISRFTEGLATGVHNAWLEGNYAYLALDPYNSGLRILDISDPASPRLAASFYGGSSLLHDVYVRDGLAFLSHWDAGLVILDVGNGMAGGSPTNPVEVSRLQDLGGQTHNVWYWPEAGYAFVGEEQFGYSTSPSGIMHVVDLADITRPREVASYEVQGATSHNYWMDEDTATLYLAWYERGMRILDVSGELMGQLELQGREAGFIDYGNETNYCFLGSEDTCTWAPQLHDNGKLYAADMNHGLVVLEPVP